MDFEDRVVIVTGGGSGIGEAIVRSLASYGATVCILDVRHEAASAIANALDETGRRSLAVAADVSSAADVRAAVELVLQSFGRIDVLINNAANSPMDGLLETTDEQWRGNLEVCLTGPFLVTKHVLPHMLRERRGSIVNIASVNGLTFLGAEAYSAAKAGLINLTKAIAARYGPYGIRANAVAPATIRTPGWREAEAAEPGIFDRLASRYPLRRVGTPNDVASAVLFLASDDAAWISGVTLPVDGGLLAGDVDRLTVHEPTA